MKKNKSINNPFFTEFSIYSPILHFKRLKNSGVAEHTAKIHVEESEKIMQATIQSLINYIEGKQFATKLDIKSVGINLKSLEVRMILWVGGLLTAFATTLFVVMAKGFGWIK